MNRKRLLGIAGTGAVCVLLAVFGYILSEEKKGVIVDDEGKVIAELVYDEQVVRYNCEDEYKAYADLACREAAAIVADQREIEESEAFRILVKEEMHIQTACRQSVMDALSRVCEDEVLVSEKAAAVSDTEGHILACYSHSLEEPGRNYVYYPTYAGSTIKPISVYGPAIEDGTICWSDLYQDSAYYQIEDADGRLTDWPVNTEPYSETMWTVQEALKKSNNAIAVKVLKDYGVEKSCEFLWETFGIHTEEERQSILENGEDSVLSNLALGYLEEGVTMQQMLSAYQTFANGGFYTPMHTVTSIENGRKETCYEERTEAEPAFSPETAYIMNRMLKTVVENGGTGVFAGIEGLDICGKTGTSDDFKDNWFIGMTPEYICAVWYEQQGIIGNESAKAFRSVMENLDHQEEISYPIPDEVIESRYCKKTGLLANEFCEEQYRGYYKKDFVPEKCNCR